MENNIEYEYDVVIIYKHPKMLRSIDYEKELKETLNKYAKDGWKPFSIVVNPENRDNYDSLIITFERIKKN